MRKILVLLFTMILLSTPVYAEVKVVGDPCYTGDVRLTSQVINTKVPPKVQEAFEAEKGFVWIKQLGEGQLTIPLTTSPYVIQVDPKINWDTTRLTVLRQFGSFVDKYQGVTKDASKKSIINSEVWKYQAMCEELSYQTPECYSPETLFEIVFAAYCDKDSSFASDILSMCPQTAVQVENAINTINTTVTLSVQTLGVQTESSNELEKQENKGGYKLPVKFGG